MLCAGARGRRAYSTDLRERLVQAVAKGRPQREAARRFGVGVTTVKRSVVRQQQTGSLARHPIPGGPRRLGREQDAWLRTRLDAAPDATLAEHGAWWAEHHAQVLRVASGAPAAGRAAYKKALAASERDEAARVAWRAALASRDVRQVVVVDESGTPTSLPRLSGWAPHDQRATGQVPRHQGKNTTLVAALTLHGLQAPWTVEGAMDTLAFERSVQEVLGPTLPPGQIVILDHLSVHQAAVIRHAIAARRCERLFLPASSPDCPPIEQAFSKSKAILRGLGARTREALLEAVRQAVGTITAEDATGWFTHAGYPLPAPPS
jgi:transposase-like protein/transposase